MATLKEIRKQHGLTQQQLAERTGLSISTITWLEAGRTRPNYSTYQALRDVLSDDLDQVEFAPKPQRRKKSPDQGRAG
jgi:transcriptional regulator with XRE-family HTH domain